MNCKTCKNWVTERSTAYGDGSVIVNFRAPDGKGACVPLGLETAADFGCNKYESGGPTVEMSFKGGAPWSHSVAGPCPDCGGTGCRRCAFTGKVRHYDDGHVGEEQTRLHPREKEQMDAFDAAWRDAEMREREKIKSARSGMEEITRGAQ